MDTSPQPQGDKQPPLCIDLDGTLVSTDTLLELLMDLARHHPARLLAIPAWVLKGRAFFKQKMAQEAQLSPDLLPYNQPLIEYLKEQKLTGRSLILITGAHQSIADAVSAHVGIFDQAIGSDGINPMTGRRKLEYIEQKFGAGGFDYIGNANPDLSVWKSARCAIVVGGGQKLIRRAGEVCKNVTPMLQPTRYAASLIRAIRPMQWVKNLIVFLPLIASHQLKPDLILQTLLAFIAFCFCASGTYLLNDLLDLSADRKHPRKRHRPFASGALPLSAGLIVCPILVLAGLSCALFLGPAFTLVLLLYMAITTAYSLKLKKLLLVDAFVLGGLYTSRLVGGHAATHIVYSSWLLGFSMFLFLSLALVKRASELHRLAERNLSSAAGRGYLANDIAMIEGLGLVSGGLATLVLAVYVSSPDVTRLYAQPIFLMLLCPLLFYWIGRLWLITHRGHMHDDPILFALKDRVSYYTVAAAGLIVLAATFGDAGLFR